MVLGVEEAMSVTGVTDEMLVHMTGWEANDFELVNLTLMGKMRQVLQY